MKIYDINGSSLQLTQWDTNRTVFFDKPSETDIVVHIFNNHNKAAKVVPTTVSQDKISCAVPNELLQEARPIYIMLYAKDGGEGRVIGSNVISVERKAKPEDYTFVENIEYTDWVQLTADAKLLMETMAASKRACDQATLDANTATDGASKVDIQMTPNPTGVTIAVTNRNGKVTEAVLDTVSQLKTWKDIQTVVRQGNAKKLIKPGDIFNANYKYNGKVYTMPWHVTAVKNAKTPSGELKEAVWIQSHLVSPIEVPFDTHEAFYVAKEELPAGTYHVVIESTWGDHHKAGDTWSFTLTKSVPVGGCLTGFENTPYSGFAGVKARSYKTIADLTPIEEAELRAGAEGTKLGDLTFTGTATMNSVQRVAYGYNRYSNSFQRQWLNNRGTGWWKPQNAFDRPPSNVASIEGFMTGFEDEFLNVLRPFKIVTAKNNATDGGGAEETTDIFVLPSLEEMHIRKQVAGEGETLPYWKEVGGTEPWPWYQATPELVHLDINNTARYVRLRSASVDSANSAWNVYPSGIVSSSGARSALASAPLAVIY